MRIALIPLVGVLILAACTMPSGPTGYAIAPPTHWVDGTDVYIEVETLPDSLGGTPTRITVTSDIVYNRILVDGNEYPLLGRELSNQWLTGEGANIVWLEPGEHVVHAYSCQDTALGWKCGCVNEDNCGNWMEKKFEVR